VRPAGKLATDFRPQLRPAIERRAQEGKYGFGHVPVLQRQVARQDLYLICGPALEAFRGFEDVRQLGFRGLGFLHICSTFRLVIAR
jgi:hypothetical protein